MERKQKVEFIVKEDLNQNCVLEKYDGVVSLAARKSLPRSSGLYLVISGHEVFYVGKSKNINTRWQNHHKINEVRELLFPQIIWIEMDIDEAGKREVDLIKRFSPRLNRVHWEPGGETFIGQNANVEYLDMSDGLRYFVETEGETGETGADPYRTLGDIGFFASPGLGIVVIVVAAMSGDYGLAVFFAGLFCSLFCFSVGEPLLGFALNELKISGAHALSFVGGAWTLFLFLAALLWGYVIL